MDMRTVETRTAYDAALAAILRGRKAELNMSRQDLADASGIPVDTFRWYLAETPRPMPVTAFLALVGALDLDPGHVVAQAMARVASTTGD
jgi:hypothetical protein